MQVTRSWVGWAGLGGVASVVACTMVDVEGTAPVASTTGSRPLATCDDPSAPTKLAPRDPKSLPGCCSGGAAHCVPRAEVPPLYRGWMATCDGADAVCIPDAQLRSGGGALKSCASAFGPGVCVSICVPAVAKVADQIGQDACATDERCVPCVDPQSNESTGVCDLGTEREPSCVTGGDGGADARPLPGSTDAGHAPEAQPCCDARGRCLSAEAIAKVGAPLDRFVVDTCGAGDRCVPTELMTGAAPRSCESLGLGPGVCLDKCLALSTFESIVIRQRDCDGDHLCVPCSVNGEKTDAPGCP